MAEIQFGVKSGAMGGAAGIDSIGVGIMAKLKKRADVAMKDAMDATVAEGVLETKFNIQTRGQPGTGKQGRIDSGRMEGAVAGEVKPLGDGQYGKFGWINDTAIYFLVQENGWDVRMIEPMFALRDAGESAHQNIIKNLKEAWGSSS